MRIRAATLATAAALAMYLFAARVTGGQAPTFRESNFGRPAVGFAESPPVRDLPDAAGSRVNVDVRERERETADKKDRSGVAAADPDGEEINEQNRERLRDVDVTAPGTPDGALSTARRLTLPLAPPNPPTLSFEGISVLDTIPLGEGYLPPDTNGEVGPNHFVQVVNTAFRIWDKTGTPLIPAVALSSLFAPLGGPCSTSNDGDGIVLYDQLADRWLISQFCLVANPNRHQLIAISKSGDPTGSYNLYDFMLPNSKFGDYPKFGVWPDGYYMSDNQFNQTITQFQGGGMFAFDRMKMLAGDPTASFIYFDSCPINTNCFGGMLPSDLDGFIPPPTGAPNVFAAFAADEFIDPVHIDALRFFDFHADFTTPANSTFVEHTGSPMPVAAFDPRTVPPPSAKNIPQPAPATASHNLDEIADRLMFRLSYRNVGPYEALIVTHTVNAAVYPAYRAGVRFYELFRGGPAGPWVMETQETFAPADTASRWMASGATNHQGDVAVGYSVSGPSVYPSIRYAARLITDAAPGLAHGEQTIVDGAGVQTSTSGRWGDYSDLTVDPTDDCTFWYTQEYYPVSSEGGVTTAPWHTRIAKFAPGACTVSPRGSITGTITSCQTGLPVPNALVRFTGGFARGTSNAGTYSATVSPGTYTGTASAAGYDTQTQSGLVVSDGGTATFSTCINATLVQPVSSGVSIVSAGNNNALDPNETVTVSFGIKNTGTLNSSNLTATLLPTGVVLSPSGAQTYGAVVAGGSTVFRSFTFTVANLLCGSTLTATLQLHDGATSFGTLTFDFTLGVPTTVTYSSGTIAVAIPDNDAAGVDIPLNVPDSSTLLDVRASVRANHTYDSDLTMTLVHPDATGVTLVQRRGGSGDDFGAGTNDSTGVPTVFDDHAATPISAGSAPFAGSFRPESPLSALRGKSSSGTWKLHIVDSADEDTGTVGHFKLELIHAVCSGVQILAAPPPVIVSEGISPPNNALDPKETVTVNLPVTNPSSTNSANLVATLLSTGGVTYPSAPQNYGAVVAGGPTVSRPFTFTSSGSCGSDVALTLALQDGATSLGTTSYTMHLGAVSPATVTFSNTTPIAIPGSGTNGTALPYPPAITVNGLPNTVTKVTVGLKAFNHTFPDDVDVLLVSPTGQKMIILSDIGGNNAAVNVNLTLDDAAASVLPDAAAFASGAWRPTNVGADDPILGPAPAGPYQNPAPAGTATLASTFLGANPNGTWSLWVIDDSSGDTGNFNGGWDLTFNYIQSQCLSPTVPTAPATVTALAGNLKATVMFAAPASNGGSAVIGYTAVASPPAGADINGGLPTLTHIVGGLTNGVSYTFTVKATNAVGDSTPSAPSNSVTPPGFTDLILSAGLTTIKAAHILELRPRIDAVRARYSLPPFAWTDPALQPGGTIKAQHILDLRAALNAAYAAASMAMPSYTDIGLTAGYQIKTEHITDLRIALLAIE